MIRLKSALIRAAGLLILTIESLMIWGGVSVILLLIAYAFIDPVPAERPPMPTAAEEKLMEAAKKHGCYVQVIGVDGIWCERIRKGKREIVWISKRKN